MRRKKATEAVEQAIAGDTRNLWRTVNSMGETGQPKTLGDYCEYPKGVSHEGAHTVKEALTQKMRDVHTYDPHDPQYDQAWHDEIQSAMPTFLQQSPDTPENPPFTSKDLDTVLKKLAGRESKSPG